MWLPQRIALMSTWCWNCSIAAMLTGKRFLQVLARLLPLALDRLGSPHQASRTKVRMRLRFGCTDQATATCWCPKHSKSRWPLAPIGLAVRCNLTGTGHLTLQVLEMLSHINKRVKGHPGIGLPLPELVALHQKPGAAPMTRNFALVYVEMAFGRATPDARLAVVCSTGCALSH
jgi:Proteasome stabiliser